MAYINKKDTQGTKPLLAEGELGYDKYVAGGDVGRVYVGTGSENIALAKKSEVDTKVAKVTSTDNAIVRFNGTTGEVQNSSVVIDDSGNVGIGTSNLEKTLSVNGAGGISVMNISSTGRRWNIKNDGNFIIGNYVSDPNTVTNNLTIDSSGNVGIGVTPSAWKSTRKAIEFPTSLISDNGAMSISIGVNNYENNSSQSVYKSNGYATTNYQFMGGHYWLTAPSGTAGNPITWTNAMTLANNGNLLVGTTTDNGVDKLQVNGSISAKGISNTAVTAYGDANTATIGVIWLDITGSANFPDTPNTRGYIIVNSIIAGDTNTKEQIYYQASTGHKFCRFQVAGTWTSWKQLTN